MRVVSVVGLLSCFFSSTCWAERRRRPKGRSLTSRRSSRRSSLGSAVPLPGAANCSWRTFNQTLDHFGGRAGVFPQRLCIYDGFVPRGEPPTHVLFYTGNESPVEEYVNNTGLMWEYGASRGSLLVWTEHRYEGLSVPRVEGLEDCMSFATIEQALADYAVVISSLKREWGDVPFVAIGGSYGGMLSAWLRMKYPGSVAGAIAASAPIWGLPLTRPPLDGAAVAVARNFGRAGGLEDDSCRENMLAAWALIFELASTQEGRAVISASFDLCVPLETQADAVELVEAVQGVFFDLAEANYPFPSTYITSAVGPGEYPLPAWPIRVACSGLLLPLADIKGDTMDELKYKVSAGGIVVDVAWNETRSDYTKEDLSGVIPLLKGVKEAWAVWCNVTGELQCLQPSHCAGTGRRRLEEAEQCTAPYTGGSWEPVCCNDDLNLVNYLSQGLGRDQLYWPPNQLRNATFEDVIRSQPPQPCSSPFDPWSEWLDSYFGRKELMTSNIVFSNGMLDPWSSAGVYADDAALRPGAYDGPLLQNISLERDLTALILPLGAHHLDLMFSHDDDPPDAIHARKIEFAKMDAWTQQQHTAAASQGGPLIN